MALVGVKELLLGDEVGDDLERAEIAREDHFFFQLPRLGELRRALALQIEHHVDRPDAFFGQAIARLQPPGIEVQR